PEARGDDPDQVADLRRRVPAAAGRRAERHRRPHPVPRQRPAARVPPRVSPSARRGGLELRGLKTRSLGLTLGGTDIPSVPRHAPRRRGRHACATETSFRQASTRRRPS
ncbi:MAG: hypothetical protein ACK56I_03360, partial [bacterium]